MTSSFQSAKRSAQAPGSLRLHPQAHRNVSLGYPVPVCRDSREGHADNSVMLGNLGNNIDPHRVRAVIEDDQNVVAVADFPYRPNHMDRSPL